MKAWIGIYVRSGNQGLLNAAENAMLSRSDSRLWNSDQYVSIRDFDIDGVEFVYASLFFSDFNERALFKAVLGGINGFLHIALPGSYLKMSKCWHDELDGNACPIRPDELEYSEEIG